MSETWTSRSFDFAFPVDRIDVVLSRLRGTIARIASVTRATVPDTLTARRSGKWSIQEHVGHLHDLESLHLRRLDELANGATRLSPADPQNQQTWDANHNARPFARVFVDFVSGRTRLVRALEALGPDDLARAAVHPRLQAPMRAIDIGFFAAEHDDHHLVAIESLVHTAPPAAPLPAVASPWLELPHDAPMALLERRRLIGSEAMISHITLHAGCDVPVHAHANEQFSCVVSGVVRFRLGDGERVLRAGDVIWFPSHTPHGAQAIETAVVLDVFSPPSATTGIDERRP